MKIHVLSIFFFILGLADLCSAQIVLPDSGVVTYADGKSYSSRFTYNFDGTLKEVIRYGANSRYVHSDFVRFGDIGISSLNPFFPEYEHTTHREDTLIDGHWITHSAYHQEIDGNGWLRSLQRFEWDSVTNALVLQSAEYHIIDTFSGFTIRTHKITRSGGGYDTVITPGSVVRYDSTGRILSQKARDEARDFRYDSNGKLDSVIVYWASTDSVYRPTYLFTEIKTFEKLPWQRGLYAVNFTEIYPNLGVRSAHFYERDSSGWKYYQTLKQGFDDSGRWTFFEDRDQRLLIDYFPEGGLRTSRNEWPGDGRVQFQTSCVRSYDGNRIINQRDTSIDVSASWPPDTSKKYRNKWTFYYNTAGVQRLSDPRMESSAFAISCSYPNSNPFMDHSSVTLFSITGQELFQGRWEELTRRLPSPGVYVMGVDDKTGGVKQVKLLVTP